MNHHESLGNLVVYTDGTPILTFSEINDLFIKYTILQSSRTTLGLSSMEINLYCCRWILTLEIVQISIAVSVYQTPDVPYQYGFAF